MKYSVNRFRSTALAMLALVLASTALAQGLDGRYRVQQDGLDFAVSLSGTATAQPRGIVHSVEGDIELRQLALMPDGSVMGVFNVQQFFAGFVGVLQADGNTLDVYFYQLDQQGSPLPNSEEYYIGRREQATPPPPEPDTPDDEGGLSFAEMIRRAQAEDQGRLVPPPPPPPPPPGVDLAGLWEGGFALEGAEFFDRIMLDASGTFVQEAYYNGQFIAMFGGSWQLAGTVLTLDATQHPDQLCLDGECGPYTYEGPDTYELQLVDANNIRLTPSFMPGLVIEYSRVQ